MQKILLVLLFLLLSQHLFGQNIFENYKAADTIYGERLTVGTSDMGYYHSSEYGNTLNLNFNANYTKWKYTPAFLYNMQAFGYTNYSRSNYYDPYIVSREQNARYNTSNENLLYLGGAISYYFKPRKFFVSAAYSAELRNYSSNYERNYSSTTGQGFLWTGMGYGRIDNAEGLEQAINVSESLTKNKIIKTKLSSATLKEIDSKLYKFRNGNYENKYIDDASIKLMKDIENILIKNNEIDHPLDAENSVRLFQILLNTSQRFFYYPRYIGSELNVQFQTQTFSYEKPKENYLKISGIYAYPISQRTNLLFSASYARKFNDDAGGYLYQFPSYYSYYSNIPDYFNVEYNISRKGLGVFEGNSYYYFDGHQSRFNLGFNITHSLNSTAGINLNSRFSYYPAHNSDYYSYDYHPEINEYFFNISGQLDYNIYSQLFSHIRAGFSKSNYRDGFNINLDFDYIIF